MKQQEFSQSVLHWFDRYGRVFPWRQTSDPYHIFVAEILLRRTQAERIKEAYLEITSRYPTFKALSAADLTELRRWFEQLGLIERADLLINAAQRVMKDFEGSLPCSLDLLLRLPGMGEYSARAVACLAFGASLPMIDEGAGRLLRRILGRESTKPAHSDHALLEVAKKMIPHEHARNFNLGLLDISSKFCHWKNPACGSCPLINYCVYGSKTNFISEKTT